eukprot:gene9240-18379_t
MAVILCMGLFLYLVESLFNVFIKKPVRVPKKANEPIEEGDIKKVVVDPEADKAEKVNADKAEKEGDDKKVVVDPEADKAEKDDQEFEM